ncbi:MAG: VWA domain-containing protein [Chitinophagaceae bacterium]|nr:VWA domain-containing protein [Chitinophagaceae bacterium]MCW5929179.1 VWA domain-containing protein [Chitinophagaceae bacterium]
MFRFQHTEYLLLLLLLPVVAVFFVMLKKWKERTAAKIGDGKLVKALIGNFSPVKQQLRVLVILVAFACLVIAAANPQSATEVETINRKGIDVMIVLDVSRSMLSEDVKPSRLERSKQLLNKLLDRISGDRVGLVIFAGRAYMQMPLTADYASAKLHINNASPSAVQIQGTVIADALQLSNGGFNTKEKKYKTILLVTDGEDHDKNAINMARKLAENGVVINTVGVGTTSGSTIVNSATGESKRDLHGNVVVSKLNEKELIDIAYASNGSYQHLNDVETVVTKLTEQFRGMEQKTIRDTSTLNFRSFFQWFLVLALLGFAGELFISEKRKIKPA